jgi:hypothetical protein
MPVTYSEAPPVQKVADKLIDSYHPALKGHRVDCLFRSEEQKTNGQVVLGTARKVAGMNAYLAQRHDELQRLPGETEAELRCAPFFLLVIAENMWIAMDDEKRSALVDHLLSRCQVKSSENGPRLMTVAPPAEFPDVLARHGMWRQDLEKLVRAAGPQQMDFFAVVSEDDGDDDKTGD